MEPTKSSTTDTSALIFETLKTEILDLTIKPGEELVESEVCKRFSVTRPPVRTAMRRLCDIGLVDIKPYYGTHATLLDLDKIYQIVHLRIVVETSILQDFIRSNPNGFIIEEMNHNIRLQELLLSEQVKDRTKFYDLDNQLHTTWFKAQHCEAEWDMIEQQRIEYMRFRMLDYESSQKFEEMIRDHRNILDAIKNNEVDEIPFLIGRHLCDGLKRTTNTIFERCKDYISEPADYDFWTEYNKRYYK